MSIFQELLGKGFGNFNPKDSSPGVIMQMILGVRAPGNNWPKMFFVSQKCGPKIVYARNAKFWQRWGDHFLAVKDSANCIVLEDPYQGAVFFPHGHAMVCLFEIRSKKDKRLAVLIFADEKPCWKLLDELFTRHQFSAKSIFADVGWGDAPCCDKENLQHKLIERLEKFGVPKDRISARPPCTSCTGRNTPEIADDFHSFRKDGEGAGCNAFVAWFG